MEQGTLINNLITQDNPQFSLQGLVRPCFQNQGTQTVYIGNRKVLPNEEYRVAANVILTNEIAIEFEKVANKTNLLWLGAVKVLTPKI